MSAEENLQRMKTLDDAWNAHNWEVFRKRHAADTKVYWPGQPDPTVGRDAHHKEWRSRWSWDIVARLLGARRVGKIVRESLLIGGWAPGFLGYVTHVLTQN